MDTAHQISNGRLVALLSEAQAAVKLLASRGAHVLTVNLSGEKAVVQIERPVGGLPRTDPEKSHCKDGKWHDVYRCKLASVFVTWEVPRCNG